MSAPLKPLPPQAVLLENFRYDHVTGKLYRVLKGGRAKETGWLTNDGHLEARFQKELYYVHRIIWKMAYGYDPLYVDHRDCDGTNNRLLNLRNSDKSGNSMNRPALSCNTSGRKGVSWHKKGQKWTAQIRKGGVRYYLGLFDTVEAAAKAHDEACLKLHGDFANTGGPLA